MDAIDVIKQNVDPIRLLEYYRFDQIKDMRHEIRACCKIHGGNNPEAFVWVKKRGLWFCFTGDCGGGDVFDLIMKMENCSFTESIKIASHIFNVSIEGMSLNDVTARYEREQVAWLEMMSNKLKAKQKTDIHYSYTEGNINFPRFDEFTIEHFDSKICSSCSINDVEFHNKLLIPVYQNNSITSIALRSLDDEVPKWKYQPRGIQLNETFYNLDNVTDYNEIVLVEGILDVWAFWESGIDNVIAVFGSHISKKQYEILMKLNVALVFCFDNDKAGQKCTKQAIDMFHNKTDYKLIQLPENCDPDDITRKELRTAYERRR